MRNLIACAFLVTVGVLIYGLTMRGVPGNPHADRLVSSTTDPVRLYGTTTDRGRFILTQNLVENHTFALNRIQADAAAPDVGYYKGNWFIEYAPGVSLLAVPFYILGTWFNSTLLATYSMSAVLATGSLILIYFISKQILKLPFWASIFASLVFGIASTSLSYATSLFQHHTTVFLILLSFYFAYQYKIRENIWGFLSGLVVWTAYGIGILSDYPNAILMLPIITYFFIISLSASKTKTKSLHLSIPKFELNFRNYKYKIRPTILFTSFIFIFISFLHAYYNLTNYGGWTNVSGSLISYPAVVLNNLDKKSSSPEKSVNTPPSTGKIFRFFKNSNFISGSYELLVAPDKGLAVFDPILILGIPGIFLAFKKLTPEIATLAAIALINFIFYAIWNDPWGGWVFGPRYLIPAMSVLSIFVAFFLIHVRQKLMAKLIAFVLTIITAGITLLGTLTTNSNPPLVDAVLIQSKLGVSHGMSILAGSFLTLFEMLTRISIPKIFNVGYHSRYGIFYALDFINGGLSNNFIFNNFLKSYLSLIQYYWTLFALIVSIFFFVLFLLPMIPKWSHLDESKL
jgi:hypothetical protein